MANEIVETRLNALLGGQEFTPEQVYVLLTAMQFEAKHGIDPFPNGLEDFDLAVEEIAREGVLDKIDWHNSSDLPPKDYGVTEYTSSKSNIFAGLEDKHLPIEKLRRSNRVVENEAHRSRDNRNAEYHGRRT